MVHPQEDHRNHRRRNTVNEDDIIDWLQACSQSADHIYAAEVFVEIHDHLESIGDKLSEGLARKLRQVFSIE